MALHGVSSGKFDIESPADKFFRYIAEDMSPSDTIPETKAEWSESVDWEKKTLTLGMSGGLISESFKTVTLTITVTPKEDEAEGSHVAWTVEFEKIRHDDDPHFILDPIVNFLKEIDEDLKH